MNETADRPFEVAIVGAGMAGLACAWTLSAAAGGDAAVHADAIVVLDKGRQVGGRMATRRMNGARFDTGAQFFTASSDPFRELVQRAIEDGVAAVWYERPPRTPLAQPFPVYRGVHGMTDVPKWMADRVRQSGVTVETSLRVTAIEPDRAGGGWRLRIDGGDAIVARAVVVTAPIPQTRALIADLGEPPHGATGVWREVGYDPCLALLVTIPDEVPLALPPHGGVHLRDDAIEWLADNRMKGLDATPAARTITVHFSGDLSRQLYDEPDEQTLSTLVEDLRGLGGRPGGAALVPDSVMWREVIDAAHRAGAIELKKWRYARPETVVPERAVTAVAPAEGRGPIIVAGDAFAGPRVEGAFLSGVAAAERVRATSV